MRRRLVALCVAGAALVVAGCGDDGDDGAERTATAPAEATVDDGTTAPSANPDDTAPTVRTEAEPPPHPAVTRQYSAGDAGRVLIAYEEGRMRLVGVHAADGWRHRVERRTPREIEIEFRDAEGRRIGFEAEVEDDGVKVDLDRDRDRPGGAGRDDPDDPDDR